MNIKKLDEDFLNEILNELQEDLDLIQPNLKVWNRRYFLGHKNRYKSNLKIVEQYYKTGEILEVGSVPCHLTYCLKKLGYPVIGLDINPESAKIFIKKHHLTVVKCDIENEKIPFEDNRFDFVMFNEIFEHLRIDPASTLREVNRVLKSSGVMMLTTPNLYSLVKIISFVLGRGFTASPYKQFERLRTLGFAGHIREYLTKEVIEFLENTGFKIINVKYEVYRKSKSKFSFFISLCHHLYPKWRPFQIIMSVKKVKSLERSSE